MKYKDSNDKLDTPKKILKVNHAGEFGAVNIYRAQLLIANVFMKDMVPQIEGFMSDEKRHLDIFWSEIQRRKGVKCKSYWLCGIGGFTMGLMSGVLGKRGIMACTWAVESVVVYHLENQIDYLRNKDDKYALDAVEAILEDEKNHRDIGAIEGGKNNVFYHPLRFMISLFTEVIIRFGMR